MLILKCVVAFYIVAFIINLFSKDPGKRWMIMDLFNLILRILFFFMKGLLCVVAYLFCASAKKVRPALQLAAADGRGGTCRVGLRNSVLF